jgi:hypothetical protein
MSGALLHEDIWQYLRKGSENGAVIGKRTIDSLDHSTVDIGTESAAD